MLRIVVCSIYSVGFWTVAGIIAAKTGTFPLELVLYYTTGLGVIVAALADKDKKKIEAAPEETP